MHIADGLLSTEVCIGAAVISAGAIGLSLRKLNQTHSLRTVPLTGMMAALVFAGQMVNFPLGFAPASGHLLGGVLAAIVVGPWAGCVAVSLVLFLQMALFADGGWLAYGANALNMAVIGSLGGYAIYSFIRRRFPGHRGTVAGAVIAAWTTVLAGSSLFCIEFALSHPRGTFDLARLFAVMTTFHSLIGVGEALITGGIVTYLLAVRPDLIEEPGAARRPLAGVGRVVMAGAIAALAIAAFAAPFASDELDGLEKSAEKLEFSDMAATPRSLLLSDYEVPLGDRDTSSGPWHKLSVSLAGLLGTSAILGMTFVLGRFSTASAPAAETFHAR